MSKQKFSAARYRELAQKNRLDEETFEIETPSGMVWTVRRPHLETFILSSQLPLSLAEKMAKAKAGGVSEDQAFQQLDIKEQIKAIEFSTKLVRHICVDPRIVDEPQSDSEISPAEILPEDFAFLVEWAGLGGGNSGDGLDSFRAGGRKAVVDSSVSKRNGRQGK